MTGKILFILQSEQLSETTHMRLFGRQATAYNNIDVFYSFNHLLEGLNK